MELASVVITLRQNDVEGRSCQLLHRLALLAVCCHRTLNENQAMRHRERYSRSDNTIYAASVNALQLAMQIYKTGTSIPHTISVNCTRKAATTDYLHASSTSQQPCPLGRRLQPRPPSLAQSAAVHPPRSRRSAQSAQSGRAERETAG